MDFNGTKPDSQLTNRLACQNGGQESPRMAELSAKVLGCTPGYGHIDVTAKLDANLILDALEDLQHGWPLVLSK